MKQYPRAHLLTGGYDALEKLPRGHRSRAALLKDLAAAICRHGPYAVTTLRNFEELLRLSADGSATGRSASRQRRMPELLHAWLAAPVAKMPKLHSRRRVA